MLIKKISITTVVMLIYVTHYTQKASETIRKCFREIQSVG